MITLFKYELCFVMKDDDDLHIEEIQADGFDDTTWGHGDNPLPVILFEREVPDPEDADEKIDEVVFAIPAHRVVYIKNNGEVPKEIETAERTAPEKDATHGGYPDPNDDEALRAASPNLDALS